jgi:hypothetical protein
MTKCRKEPIERKVEKLGEGMSTLPRARGGGDSGDQKEDIIPVLLGERKLNLSIVSSGLDGVWWKPMYVLCVERTT